MPETTALETAARTSLIAGAIAGLAGPVLFTAAWIISSLRQTGYSPADIALSGLAAPDARDPWIMLTAFPVLGVATIMFGHALPGAGNAGRRLIQAAGLLTIAAGLLRRDHMLLTRGPVSWHNHAHDIISVFIYVDLVLAQLLLARDFGQHPEWRAWRPWLFISAAATAAVLVWFGINTSAPDAGILQRVLVSIPLAVIAAIATSLLRKTRSRSPLNAPLHPDQGPSPVGQVALTLEQPLMLQVGYDLADHRLRPPQVQGCLSEPFSLRVHGHRLAFRPADSSSIPMSPPGQQTGNQSVTRRRTRHGPAARSSTLRSV
jgi:hypothetical membrane protein